MRLHGRTARRALLFATYVLAAAMRAYAQQPSAVVTGRITDALAGIPLTGVTVRVDGTTLSARTDTAGRYRLTPVPTGPQVLVVTRIGYAPLRSPLVVPAEGSVTLDFALAKNALQLPGLVVTADVTGRARGELGTASVIGQEAIKNQTAASLQGVLELVPGTVLQPPGLDNVQQFSLRAVPIGPTVAQGSGSVAGPNAQLLASFGTQIVLDGVPASNNVNLQSLGARGELSLSSAGGGGIDLRRIPAATLERVEVIRGVPSSRFGDLTQGVVLVDTRAGTVDPEALVRLDARTTEATLVGGKRLLGGLHAATASLDVARTSIAPGLRDVTGSRVSAQLSHRYQGGSVTLDTRLDGYQVLDDNPPTTEDPNLGSQARDRGLRVSERLGWHLGRSSRLDWTVAYEGAEQRSYTQSPRLRGATPFTDRLTEGTQDGHFVGGTYVARVDLDGDPQHLYSRIESYLPTSWLGLHQDLSAGLELRREWSGGPGYQFDIEFPPQVEFNGVNGYDRPRRFDAIPPLVTSGFYLDDRVAQSLGGSWILNVQAGLRLDLLHHGSTWASGTRDQLIQPRLQLELSPSTRLRLRAGAGRYAKVPALGQLFPAAQYYDLVNFNWYANDATERRAIVTTRILPRENASLNMSRADKAEAGIEMDLGRGSQVSLVGYLDRIHDAVGVTLQPTFLLRDHYLVDSSTINQGRPPDVLQPPAYADTVPVLIDRPDNNLDLRSSGLELTAILPEIAPLSTRIAAQAAWSWSRLSSTGLDFGVHFDQFQLNENAVRAPYWESVVQTGQRLLVTTRVIHHQPRAGLVITGTLQLYLKEIRVNQGGTDTLSFAGYITRSGQLVPVPPDQRGDPQYHDLRVARLGYTNIPQEAPVDWLFNLQVSKSLPLNGRLSFYAFNAFDRIGSYGGQKTAPQFFAATRFGLEISMPLGLAWGER